MRKGVAGAHVSLTSLGNTIIFHKLRQFATLPDRTEVDSQMTIMKA